MGGLHVPHVVMASYLPRRQLTAQETCRLYPIRFNPSHPKKSLSNHPSQYGFGFATLRHQLRCETTHLRSGSIFFFVKPPTLLGEYHDALWYSHLASRRGRHGKVPGAYKVKPGKYRNTIHDSLNLAKTSTLLR